MTLAGSARGGAGRGVSAGLVSGRGDSFAAGRVGSVSRRTANTALHTAQRARTPAPGTLAGSTR
jgi:hypothetical protein